MFDIGIMRNIVKNGRFCPIFTQFTMLDVGIMLDIAPILSVTTRYYAYFLLKNEKTCEYAGFFVGFIVLWVIIFPHILIMVNTVTKSVYG